MCDITKNCTLINQLKFWIISYPLKRKKKLTRRRKCGVCIYFNFNFN